MPAYSGAATKIKGVSDVCQAENPNTDIGVNASNVVPSSNKDAIVQVHAAVATGVMYSHIGAQVRKDFPTRRYTHIVAAPAEPSCRLLL